MRVFILCLCVCLFANDQVLDFDLIKMPTEKKQDPLVLIVSGIQGDEPGGFNATNLFLQHYKILSGEVWIVPNLNKHSILRNHRGIYGDMNRKFKTLDSADREYLIVERIKNLILDERVRVIYHLHDGSGFYRNRYIDALQNPNRWGNCSIIDQETVSDSYYENLNFLSEQIVEHINQKLLKNLHRYHVRNTYTATRDKEMEKSLTFFAIRNHKTALANEVSKNLPVSERVYYHLLGIEGMLNAVGVQFKRDFELSPKNISALIQDRKSYIQINQIVTLPVFELRPRLSFFPLPNLNQLDLKSNHYIVGFLQKNNRIVLKYGNRVVSTLDPFVIEFSNALSEVDFLIDGAERRVKMGEIVRVKDWFLVNLKDGQYRVNIIGFRGGDNENKIKIAYKNLIRRYSIDKREKKYRVEFYDSQNRFAGMVIVDFT